MSSYSSTHFPTRKLIILSVLFIVLIIIAFVFLHFRVSLSPHTGQPSEQFVCSSEQAQYPISTDKITISVSNIGEYAGEIEKPHLEIMKDNTWHIVNSATQEDITSNLLYFPPGSSSAFDIFLSPYKSTLTPGQYRAVFPFSKGSEFFSFNFDLI